MDRGAWQATVHRVIKSRTQLSELAVTHISTRTFLHGFLVELPGVVLVDVQFAQSCTTLCDPMACSTPGFLVLHRLPELVQTHVH